MKSILIIEDNPLLSGLYKAAFEKEKIEVFIAHDGSAGLELARTKKPNIILLDLMMVGISGFDVLKFLREDPVTKNVKVIILTVANDEKLKAKARSLGAIDYLIKSDLKVSEIVQSVSSHF